MSVVQITSRNVNGAFANAWWQFRVGGVQERSRNGPVLVMKDPVVTTYLRPQERVLFDARRDANPVFHLVETLWMFAGLSNVSHLLPFNSNYGQYAEPDGTVHGAYGERWRHGLGLDQITTIIELLKDDPYTRQAVMQMWEAESGGYDDLRAKVKDKPCNTHIYFDGRQGLLNMTVCCRSNDMLWGAYGANVVHFSMLQELIAWGANLGIGEYRQFSNNFHVYTELPMVKAFIESPPYDEDTDNPYSRGDVRPTPMFRGDETVADFMADCADFFHNNPVSARTAFFREDAYPLAHAYIARKYKEKCPLLEHDGDWNVAFRQWAERRDHGKGE